MPGPAPMPRRRTSCRSTFGWRGTTDPAARLQPRRSHARRRREEAAARAVRPLAAPVLSVLARQHLAVRHDLRRLPQLVADAVGLHHFGGDGKAVVFAAAPFIA